jgi:3-methyl-2-oxobutanoate hydroxymethyltransferase
MNPSGSVGVKPTPRPKITAPHIIEMKRKGEPIVVVTAYDHPTARLADEAGIEILLVGDSVGTVLLGYENTLPVTVEDILHHTKAVARAHTSAMVVADMPFLSYQVSEEQAVLNAGRMVKEGGGNFWDGDPIAGAMSKHYGDAPAAAPDIGENRASAVSALRDARMIS